MSFRVVNQSVSLLRKYPLLYIPDLFFIALNSIMIYLFYTVTGAADVLTLIATSPTLPLEILQTYLSENIATLIVSSIVFGVITFTVGVGVQVFKFSIITEMLEGKKITVAKAWKNRKRYFWDIVIIRVLVFLISLAAILFVAIVSAVVYLLTSLVLPSLAVAVTSVVAVLLTAALLLYVKFAIQFQYPILF